MHYAPSDYVALTKLLSLSSKSDAASPIAIDFNFTFFYYYYYIKFYHFLNFI